ncbi:hypothetical protein C8R45DRAFT_1084078 [Mycena sanguinolenta]|nr:hypothetical protein C8R45DRAFT_1084078 [Mycena sanguinolenta]
MNPDESTLRDIRRRRAMALGTKLTLRTAEEGSYSAVPRARKISRTLALKCYKLEPSDLVGLQYQEFEFPLAVRSRNKGLDVVVSLYSEREVEQVAWHKYGGPEQFEQHLLTLREQYIQDHPLGGWEFNRPQPVSRTTTRLRARRITKDESGPLFPRKPLALVRTSVQPKCAQTSDSFHPLLGSVQLLRQPQMSLRQQFAESNCLWMYDAGTRVLAFPSNISNSPWVHPTPAAADLALRNLLSLARLYPPRPTTPLTSSRSYAALRAILARAPSLLSGRMHAVQDSTCASVPAGVEIGGGSGTRITWRSCSVP